MICEVCGKDEGDTVGTHTLCSNCSRAYSIGIRDESMKAEKCERMLVDADTVLGFISSRMWTAGFLSCMSQDSVMKYAEQIQTAREVLNDALKVLGGGKAVEIYHANYEGDYKH